MDEEVRILVARSSGAHPVSILTHLGSRREGRSRWPKASVPISRTCVVAHVGTASVCACARAQGARSSLRAVVRDAPDSPPESGRLVRTRDVRRVFATAEPSHGTRVVLFLAPGSGLWTAVAARRIGGAVERNRAKRVLREAWRQVSPQLTGDFDAVLVAREAIRGATTQDLVNEMSDLLARRESER